MSSFVELGLKEIFLIRANHRMIKSYVKFKRKKNHAFLAKSVEAQKDNKK
jgi:hypothetical protein